MDLLELCFHKAHKKFSVPKILDSVEVSQQPEEFLWMLYLSLIRDKVAFALLSN